MRRNESPELLGAILIASVVWNCVGEAALAEGFDFNDGTVQGWTLDGPYDPGSGSGPFSSNFVDGWSDSVNFPNAPGSDPTGDNQGSLQMFTAGGHGIEGSSGDWWLMVCRSPDLSSSEVWQKASGYSVRIAERMGGGSITLYANLYVTVYDFEQKRERSFLNGTAIPLVYDAWRYHSFDDWLNVTNAPTDYTVLEVFIYIWGAMPDDSFLNGGIYLDEVVPTGAVPDIYVDDDGGGPGENGSREHPFDTIQEGIDAAVNGQTVVVLDGKYTGNGNRDISFNGKAITIRSENGPENCVVDCNGTALDNHQGFYFDHSEDASSVLQGFTIINGHANEGGAIYCGNGSPTITGCIIRDNKASAAGGGICCDGSSAVIRSCVIVGNQAGNGAGIYCASGSPVFTNCTVIDNTADYGGGVYCVNSDPEINNCIFWRNTAHLSGTEIAIASTTQPSTLTISYSDVAGGSEAAYVEPGCTLNWDMGNIKVAPIFKPDGYHLLPSSPCIDSGDPTVDYTEQADIDSAPRFFNGRVDIGADEFSPQIRNVTQDTYHNTIQQAIDASMDGDRITVSDGIFTGKGNRDITFKGRAITLCSENGPRHCIIDCHGTAEKQHQGFFFAYGEDANSVLQGFTVMNGYSWQGGAIWCFGSSPTIINCTFRGNIAHDNGGAIYCKESSPAIGNCTFNVNNAVYGGAIYCHEGSSSMISDCTFIGNTADWGGCIYCASASEPTVNNCILWENTASRNGSQIALASTHDPSALTISYSNVTGGYEAAYVETGCRLNWGDGNIDEDPFLTPDGHLRFGSPCIDRGPDSSAFEPDIDGEVRPDANGVDIGCDEFVDTDGDRLPDWWESEYFDSSITVNPGNDPDGDGLTNLQEYELYSSDPNTLPYYVDANNGDDSYNGLSSTYEGGDLGPKKTIQAGIDVASDGDTVLVAAGTYTGAGNRQLNFAGKSVVLRASDGPATTRIDCGGVWSRAFDFYSLETPATAVVGFTISNGLRDYAGAIYCWSSHPQIRNCVITGNTANISGGAFYCSLSMPTIADCNISENSPNGIQMYYGGAYIVGTVQMASNNWTGKGLMLTGDGTLHLQSDAALVLDESRIRCNLSGTGSVWVDLGSELIIEGDANIDMLGDAGTKGTIQCDGLLLVKNNAQIRNTEVNITRASFEGNADISNSVIVAEAGAPYGQFFIEDTVGVNNNEIHADGDRYMDLDPSVFAGVIQSNRIYVTITEGQNNTRGGLLELRGRDLEVPPCESNEFFCRIDKVPNFDTNTWMIEQLELVEGAKLNLTNRFDFGNGGSREVMYVKQLVLGDNSVLNTAFNRLYCESIDKAETAMIKNIPFLGFSLDNIACDDETEFIIRVQHNNFIDPDGDYSRIHVERVTGRDPDPKGMIRMSNLAELNPSLPDYGQVVNARAKGSFAKASEDRVLVLFEYLFETSDPDAELVVYLSDIPELLDRNDLGRADHYIEVARLPAPPIGRPGSAGSGRFGVFEETVSAEHLDFIRGTRIELELVGPDGTSALIDNWDPQVHCTGICMDLNWSDAPDEEDFLIVIGEYGKTAGLLGDATNSRACLDGVFSADGFVDSFDIVSWDWALSDPERSSLLNLCRVPLTRGTNMMSIATGGLEDSAGPVSVAGLPESLSDLLIAGKRSTSDDPVALKSQDRLYLFDGNAQFVGWSDPKFDRCNVRLIKGLEGQLYQINSGAGVLRLDEMSEVIVPPGQTSYANEPRYNGPATVYVGIQNEGSSPFGRPILDAAFDGQYIYVLPVVVNPHGGEAYAAAAKLQMVDAGSPPYRVVQLYDDPPPLHDNQHRNNLREIEIDSAGNLYVLNVHSRNESSILWKYGSAGTVQDRLDLGNPNSGSYIPDPIAMHVSDVTNMVYLASAQYNEGSYSTTIYGFSKEQLAPERSITISGMQHVAGVTEDPATGSLWVAGFTMESIPEFPDPTESPFYYPCLAKIPSGGGDVQVVSLLGSSDLGLPMSIVWTAPPDN